MITKPDRLTFTIIVLLVESPHTLGAIGVKLNRSVINLTHGLQLDIIAPNPGLALSLAVLHHSLVCNENLKVFLARQNVLHTFLPDLQVVIRRAVNLV